MATQGMGCADSRASEGTVVVGRLLAHESQADTAKCSDPGHRPARQHMVALGRGSKRTHHPVHPNRSGRGFGLGSLIES